MKVQSTSSYDPNQPKDLERECKGLELAWRSGNDYGTLLTSHLLACRSIT
jgi:hypothetical protein